MNGWKETVEYVGADDVPKPCEMVTRSEYDRVAERADMYRRQLGGMNAAHSRRKKELERVKAENAELRRLVLDMWPHVRHRSKMCGECGLHEECRRSESPCLLYGPLEKRMWELGMEVEDED